MPGGQAIYDPVAAQKGQAEQASADGAGDGTSGSGMTGSGTGTTGMVGMGMSRAGITPISSFSALATGNAMPGAVVPPALLGQGGEGVQPGAGVAGECRVPAPVVPGMGGTAPFSGVLPPPKPGTGTFDADSPSEPPIGWQIVGVISRVTGKRDDLTFKTYKGKEKVSEWMFHIFDRGLADGADAGSPVPGRLAPAVHGPWIRQQGAARRHQRRRPVGNRGVRATELRGRRGSVMGPEETATRTAITTNLDPSMRLIVMKFGGTSLADAERMRQAGAIVRRFSSNRLVVVVVGPGGGDRRAAGCAADAAAGRAGAGAAAPRATRARDISAWSRVCGSAPRRPQSSGAISKPSSTSWAASCTAFFSCASREGDPRSRRLVRRAVVGAPGRRAPARTRSRRGRRRRARCRGHRRRAWRGGGRRRDHAPPGARRAAAAPARRAAAGGDRVHRLELGGGDDDPRPQRLRLHRRAPR